MEINKYLLSRLYIQTVKFCRLISSLLFELKFIQNEKNKIDKNIW